jgi:hypothetical protein
MTSAAKTGSWRKEVLIKSEGGKEGEDVEVSRS